MLLDFTVSASHRDPKQDRVSCEKKPLEQLQEAFSSCTLIALFTWVIGYSNKDFTVTLSLKNH